MKQALSVLLSLSLLLLVAQAQGQDQAGGDEKKCKDLTDAVEILKKVDAACKAVKTVKYDIAVELVVADEPRLGKYEAHVIASGFVQGEPEKYLVDVRWSAPKSDEVRRITGGGDGETYFLIDHQAKKAYEDIDPRVVGSHGETLRRAAMIEFVADQPFTDEINGKVKELKECKKVGGEDCYVVHVVYAVDQAPEATWFFSKKDFLPRGRIDEGKLPDGRAWKQTKLLSNLVADPKLDKSVFRLELPEGYEKTDDFAP